MVSERSDKETKETQRYRNLSVRKEIIQISFTGKTPC